MKIYQYAVVYADTPENLTREIQELLNADDGWTPQGGVAFSNYTPGVSRFVGIYQAMIRQCIIPDPEPQKEEPKP